MGQPDLEIGTYSHPKSLEASKWLKAPMLLSEKELAALFNFIAPFKIFKAGGIIKDGHFEIGIEAYLEKYKQAIAGLKEGDLKAANKVKNSFSAFLTKNTDAIFAISVNEHDFILKVKKPIIQLQMHTLAYSLEDGRFRSMVYGESAFFFGILFSYPQLMKAAETETIVKIDRSLNFPNTDVFKKLLAWQRENTLPTPFLVNGKRINVPARLGKGSFSWINAHPSFKKSGLRVLLPGEKNG